VNTLKIILYLVAILTSAGCAVLLIRGYLKRRIRLLLWSSICFVALALANIVLFADLVIFPEVDFHGLRQWVTLVGLLFLLYGFIWDSE